MAFLVGQVQPIPGGEPGGDFDMEDVEGRLAQATDDAVSDTILERLTVTMGVRLFSRYVHRVTHIPWTPGNSGRVGIKPSRMEGMISELWLGGWAEAAGPRGLRTRSGGHGRLERARPQVRPKVSHIP